MAEGRREVQGRGRRREEVTHPLPPRKKRQRHRMQRPLRSYNLTLVVVYSAHQCDAGRKVTLAAQRTGQVAASGDV